MNEHAILQLLPFAAAPLMLAVLAAAAAALMARSLFAMCVGLAAAGATGSVTLLALSSRDGALALAMVAAGWAPVLLFGAMLLSTRTSKSGARGLPWLTGLAGAGAILVFAWVGLRIEAPAPLSAPHTELGVLAAPLLLVVASICIGLLGFGERGVLDAERRGG
jgi:hypothetical protein